MLMVRYGEQGFVEELPSLSMGRHSHGCAAYIDTEGVKVGRWGQLETGDFNMSF